MEKRNDIDFWSHLEGGKKLLLKQAKYYFFIYKKNSMKKNILRRFVCLPFVSQSTDITAKHFLS